jgi:3-hydroxyisobutyrate dehydrogenase/glyoxylate/succinic semialdehyde reductase
MDVAFLGLGIMGSRMAANLSKAGHSTRVWNRNREKAAALAGSGCSMAPSPALAVKGARIVFTMLADPEALRQTAFGTGGFLDAMEPGTLWVDHSTVDPGTSRQLGQNAVNRGLRFVDAPVSGSAGAAANAKLIFFAGGALPDLEEVSPLLAAMGTRVVHAGPVGSGAAMKLVNNLFLAQAQTAWSEALGLAHKLGLKTSDVHDAILPTHVAPPFLTLKRSKIESKDWSPEFPLKHALKDIRLALDAARDHGIRLRQLETAEEIYSEAASRGLGDSDISAVHEIASRTDRSNVAAVVPAPASEPTAVSQAAYRG